MSARKFNVDINKMAKKLDLAVGVVTTKLALDGFKKLVEFTPADTGRARASWSIKTGSPSNRIPKPKDYYPDPPEPQVTFDGTKSVFLTSALDYMRFLDQGSSKQAPVGIVILALAELEAEAEFILGQNL